MRIQSYNERLVIEQVPLVEYYNQHIVPLGSKFQPISESKNTGLCPFHVDTDPSLHYWKRKNIYHCFGCGYGGDVVRTHMKLRRQYFGEAISLEVAVKQLASIYGIELNEETGNIVKSVFEIARGNLLDSSTYHVPKDIMTIATFNQLNNRVKRSNVALHSKVSNYEHLDAIASATIIQGK